KFGHPMLKSERPRETQQFIEQVLGFRLSDDVGDGTLLFLRCNADHHGIGITKGGEGLHHYAWEVENIGALGMLGDVLEKNDGRVSELPVAACGVLELIELWAETEPILRGFDPQAATEVAGAELVLPLKYPRKVLCSGANYHAHMREMKVDRPDDARPYFFLKPPTTALVGPGEPIV